MIDVTGVGTNSADEVLRIPLAIGDLLASGKTRARERELMPGGQTATAMAACAALGLRSRYIGAFGSDTNAHVVRHALQQRGVDLAYGAECDGPNRSAVIIVDAAGRRTVVWHLSDRLRLPAIDPAALDARIVHVDDDDPRLALSTAAAAGCRGIPVTSDIEHAWEGVEQIITAVTYPIFSESLPATLTGESDPERALRKLRRLNDHLLVMTLGEHGAAALDGDRFHAIPAFTVAALDTTGAGDVFRAGVIYGLLHQLPTSDVLTFANAAAALSCTRRGAIPSVPTLEEVQALCREPR